MTYKTILTHLDSSSSLPSRVKLAANLANRQSAHLIGVAPAGIAVIPGDGYLSITSDLITELQAQLDSAANAAVQQFETICKDMGVDSVESFAIGNVPSDMILLQARYCDLVVISQADTESRPSGANRGFVEQVVLGAGKPVIVVPNTGHCVDMGKRVIFAWDGSREAARAATDAMPILAAADTVEVLVVNEKTRSGFKHGPVPGTDIALYLARQGVNVEVRNLQSDIDIGDTLLSHAADFGADLIVMGSYGHSRLREWVMGGATRTLLNSMTVPVLMSH